MPITADQARDIAKNFLDVSHDLGTYRFAHWAELSAGQRRQIEDLEWDLLSYSNSFTTAAVGIALNNMQDDLDTIADATGKARRVVKTIKTVKNIINVVTALVGLGGAIISKNPSAIVNAAGNTVKAANNVLKTANT